MRSMPLALAFIIPLGGCVDPPAHDSPYAFPLVSLDAAAEGAQITVRHADGGVTWRDVELRADQALRFALNAPLDHAPRVLDRGAAWTRVTVQSASIEQGDRLAFCTDSPEPAPATVRLRHAATVQRLGVFELADLPGCPASP